MLLNHTQAFADFTPAQQIVQANRPAPLPMPKREEISAFKPGTLLETRSGWQPAEQLRPGDAVCTLDGGFATIASLRQRRLGVGPDQHWHIPAGSLNNCSDISLTRGQHVAIMDAACDQLFGTPCVLAPITAMAGYRGITAAAARTSGIATELTFETEEIVYAQTGMLLHVPSGTQESFFRTLGYGETRALLTLMNRGHCAPDLQLLPAALAA